MPLLVNKVLLSYDGEVGPLSMSSTSSLILQNFLGVDLVKKSFPETDFRGL